MHVLFISFSNTYQIKMTKGNHDKQVFTQCDRKSGVTKKRMSILGSIGLFFFCKIHNFSSFSSNVIKKKFRKTKRKNRSVSMKQKKAHFILAKNASFISLKMGICWPCHVAIPCATSVLHNSQKMTILSALCASNGPIGSWQSCTLRCSSQFYKSPHPPSSNILLTSSQPQPTSSNLQPASNNLQPTTACPSQPPATDSEPTATPSQPPATSTQPGGVLHSSVLSFTRLDLNKGTTAG